MSEFQDETELIGALMGLPIFADLDYADIEKLLNICERYEVEAGAALCEPDTIDENLTIFLGGKLRLETREGDKLADVTQLRVIGEMGVFTGQPRSSRVLAEQTSDVLVLQGAALKDLAEENPDLGAKMLSNLLKLLYERTHDTNDHIQELQEKLDQLTQRLSELAPDDPLLASSAEGT